MRGPCVRRLEYKMKQHQPNRNILFAGAARGVFVESLGEITPDDLGERREVKKKKLTGADILRHGIFVFAVAVFVYCLYNIVDRVIAYEKAENIYSQIQDEFHNINQNKRDDISVLAKNIRDTGMALVNTQKNDGPVINPDEFNERFVQMRAQLILLQKKNQDTVGWIRIPDTDKTAVDYPIMQGPEGTDNDYYLRRAFDGTYNQAGSIFMDYRNRGSLSDMQNTIIYGHHMSSGAPMFANLVNYKSQGFWQTNRYIEVYTTDGIYTYEIFAAYEVSPYYYDGCYFTTDFSEEGLFARFLAGIAQNNGIETGVTVTEKDRILTLSTCSDNGKKRFAVHGKLVSIEN